MNLHKTRKQSESTSQVQGWNIFNIRSYYILQACHSLVKFQFTSLSLKKSAMLHRGEYVDNINTN